MNNKLALKIVSNFKMLKCTRFFIITLLLWGGLLHFSHAQTPNPRVFIIFDTSGSMLWNYPDDQPCYGDGSVDYPHRNGCDNTTGSKLFHAKRALAQVINASPEVEFALLRYGQLEPNDPDFGNLQTSVGSQYQDANGTVISTNYDGSTNGCGPADYLVEPSFNSNDEVLDWIDGIENYPNQKELRANGYTPLTDSLDSALSAVRTSISLDPESQCRAYYVLLLTDGYQQCPNVAYESAAYRQMTSNQLQLKAESLRTLREAGFDYDVRTFVVGFGSGTSFATELDALARSGGTAINGQGQIDLVNGLAYQANDPGTLATSLQAAINNARPRESCDGIDNDCDGQVDEDFQTLGETCFEGIGACNAQGIVECGLDGDSVQCSVTSNPAEAESCDQRDNDCDGQVDEGVTNACGNCGDASEVCDGIDNDCDGAVDEQVANRCGGCGAIPVEVCNGRDDDCDNRIDEGVLNACGACGQTDLETCDCNDNDCDSRIDEGLNCPQCNCVPSEEVCDSIDNDCDLRIDEGVQNACNRCGPDFVEICNGLDEDCDGRIDEQVPEVGSPCGMNVGACMAGVNQCVDGDLSCEGATSPVAEVCDMIDNDCDGRSEEGLINACGQCGASYGEVCDNIDNDCDGADDTRDLCGPELICLNGECTQPCMSGECFGGRICIDGFCSTPCVNRECPNGQVCQNGFCTDPCIGFDCREGTYCSLGRCIPEDCYGLGCPEGEICIGAVCQPDPCVAAGCGPQQGCVDGRCFEDCDAVICPEGTACENGVCTDDPCLRLTCQHHQVCVAGACVPDPCFERECNVGFICEQGECIEDPCLRTTCPQGDTCLRGICSSMLPNATPNQMPMDDLIVESRPTATPEGCSCDSQSQYVHLNYLLFVIFYLGFSMIYRRQRKKIVD